MPLRTDHLVRATALEGLIGAFAMEATALVNDLRSRHGTDPAVTAALGRLATGALFFGAMLKGDAHMVTIRIRGSGPAGTLLASANGTGGVRALVGNPQPDIAQVRNGKLNVSGAVGTTGHLTVTRDLGMGQPYNGTVDLVSGEVGQDLAHYLARSEQVPSAVGIGVFWIVHILPEKIAEAIEANQLVVAAVLSIQLLNQGALGAFRGTVRAVSGDADLSVLGWAGALDEKLLPEVLAVPGVRAAVPLWRAEAALDGHPDVGLEIVGADLLAAADAAIAASSSLRPCAVNTAPRPALNSGSSSIMPMVASITSSAGLPSASSFAPLDTPSRSTTSS